MTYLKVKVLKYYLLFYNFIFIIITLFVKWKIKFKFKQQS